MIERVFADLPVYTLVIDRRDRVRWANRAIAEVHGVTPEDVIGARVNDIWPDAGPMCEHHRHAACAGRPVRDLLHVPTLTGGQLWSDTQFLPMRVGALLTGVDVTAHIRLNALSVAMLPSCPPHVARSVLMLDRLPPRLKQPVAQRLAARQLVA